MAVPRTLTGLISAADLWPVVEVVGPKVPQIVATARADAGQVCESEVHGWKTDSQIEVYLLYIYI